MMRTLKRHFGRRIRLLPKEKGSFCPQTVGGRTGHVLSRRQLLFDRVLDDQPTGHLSNAQWRRRFQNRRSVNENAA